MCGIAGFVGDFAPSLLDRMNAAQAHRGPDGSGTYYDPDNQLGLAHVRLAILDLSDAGLQPMWSTDRRLAIIFNGEIYNSPELKKGLEARGHAFRSKTDTEVLLALFREHGAEMLPRLNGMFAFAIWDSETRELLLARDRFGVKPLYLGQTDRGLLFASELRALLAEPSVSRDVDPAALSNLLTYVWVPAPATPLRAVRKLEPGKAMLLRGGRLVREWRFAALPATPSREPQPVGETVERVRALMDQAVSRQLLSDVPVGAFLSGGLDSTSVVAFARRHYVHEDRMQCFTLGQSDADDGFVSDLPYAQTAAQQMDVRLNEVAVDQSAVAEIPAFLASQDEPIADPAAFNVLQICREARASGLKVLLSGAGGDDLFSGYRRHSALGVEPAWSWLPQPLRRLASAGAARLPASRSQFRRVRKAVQYAHLSPDERLISYFFWAPPEHVRALTGVEVDAAAPLRSALAELPRGTPPLEKMLYLEKRFFLVDHNLNYTDKAAMRAGVEVRVPFLDNDLVDYAATIHASLKVRRGTPKWILKHAMEGVVPRETIWRPKSGFGGPLAKWLRGPLRPWLQDELASNSLDGLVDSDEVAKLQAGLEAGAVDSAYALFTIASFSAWTRANSRLPVHS